ncbi:hypothetical protein CEUSTIGMA_g9220.t1 [Chlamydomonas eustigma]|uniref:MYCBP-associated protein n=1 Tax=Chlamydomonas eustigma TaxID=1157962 RepID=A0A250XFU7_9CHLO|nr:hypothetical protein CEUSTIGMA_g9220.t1 [Chlamydomonas eustigma]|eukprot:GAX81792.1 hypothetical protein CEUSTIGMA_g9220.t1 [Chlamydomonas eustigma]
MIQSFRQATVQPVNHLKGYQVLGDFQEFEQKLAEVTLPPPPPILDTVDNTDSSEFPHEIWEAASISPDRGAAIIKAYRSVRSAREQYKSQLMNIHTSRQAKLAAVATPVAASISSKFSNKNALPSLAKGVTGASGLGTFGKTLTEAIKDGSEPRKLARFEQAEKEWSENVLQLAQRTQRPDFEVTMQRGAEWRQQVEAIDALERAKPINDRMGGEDAWSMSLRDAWERVVPVGGMFSGLSAVIRENPADKPHDNLMRVGRPLDPPNMAPPTSTLFTNSLKQQLPSLSTKRSTSITSSVLPDAASVMLPVGNASSLSKLTGPGLTKGSGRSLTLRNRDWQHSDWLKSRTEQYARNIRKLYPHDPDLMALVLKGQALETQLEDLAYAPVTLSEVEQQLAGTDLVAYEAYMEVRRSIEEKCRAELAEQQVQERAAAAAAAAAGPQPGPHLRLSHTQLELSTSATAQPPTLLPTTDTSPTTTMASFTMTHVGTAAVYYTWVQQPVAHSTSAASICVGGLPPGSGFSLSKSSGILLPGATEEFKVVFRQTRPGSFSQQWTLSTTPLLLDWRPLTITARGVCMPEDGTGVERAALDEDMKQKEKMKKVQAALERVLRNIEPAPAPAQRPTPLSQEQEADNEAFDRMNADATPPLFYSPQSLEALKCVYADVVQQTLLAMQPPAEDLNAKKKGGKKDSRPPTAPQPSPLPEAWDCSVSNLRLLIQELGRISSSQEVALQSQPLTPSTGERGTTPLSLPLPDLPYAAAAEALLKRVEAAELGMRVPTDERVLLKHSMRQMLRGVSEALAVRLQAVHEDYDLRVQEQERLKEEAAAKAAAGGRAASGGMPPGAVDARWLAEKCRAAAKSLLKQSVFVNLEQEKAAGKESAGDALELQIQQVDIALAELFATSSSADPKDVEGMHWKRFELLRTWSRLGIPSRPPNIV